MSIIYTVLSILLVSTCYAIAETNFPYTPNNLNYKIWYNGSNGDFWVAQDLENPQKDIAHIAMYRGRVVYKINPSTKFRPLQEVFTESYEDAKKIVMEEQNTANK